jgi:hypothetical protein
MDLLPQGVEVIRAKALPVKPVRFLGDLALRSFYWYRQELFRLARAGQMDFLHITIPANYSALLGPLVYCRFGVPYGIDYIDPWVPEFPRKDGWWTKAGLSYVLAERLEPFAVSHARLITGINELYFASVLRRNPHLRERAETASMPYGGSENDFALLRERPRKPFLFNPADGKLHVLYAGALLPKALGVLDRLLAALVFLRESNPALAERLRLHFVGTGLYESDSTRGHAVKPSIEKYGLTGMVDELPSRISYLDVLNHLQLSTAILVIGSTEVHYSPSKIYQAIAAQRPVFALLHEKSTAVEILRDSRAGDLFTFNEAELPEPPRLAEALDRFLTGYQYSSVALDSEKLLNVSARATTRLLAKALDRAYLRERKDHDRSRASFAEVV